MGYLDAEYIQSTTPDIIRHIPAHVIQAFGEPHIINIPAIVLIIIVISYVKRLKRLSNPLHGLESYSATAICPDLLIKLVSMNAWNRTSVAVIALYKSGHSTQILFIIHLHTLYHILN